MSVFDTTSWGVLTSALESIPKIIGNFNWLNANKEPSLGNPASDGLVLSSTRAGERIWVAGGSGSGTVSRNIDGGGPGSVYTAAQRIDGGGPGFGR